MDAPTTKAGRDDRAVEAADEEAQAPAEGAGGQAMDVDATGHTGGAATTKEARLTALLSC